MVLFFNRINHRENGEAEDMAIHFFSFQNLEMLEPRQKRTWSITGVNLH